MDSSLAGAIFWANSRSAAYVGSSVLSAAFRADAGCVRACDLVRECGQRGISLIVDFGLFKRRRLRRALQRQINVGNRKCSLGPDRLRADKRRAEDQCKGCD